MIFRLLLAIFIVGLIVLLFKRVFKKLNKPTDEKKIDHFKDTVTCETCGLRLPKQDAIEKDGQYYCCKEHAGK